ncbi:hypothetical protein [Actinoplanes sp. URMC 104]|uniref:hypothetical protein n=1 Tax=Actinoplanes sp. URMC 104 TaxID=3423409 RepID=UPI003F1C5D04
MEEEEEEGEFDDPGTPSSQIPSAVKPAALQEVAGRARTAAIDHSWQSVERFAPERSVVWSLDIRLPASGQAYRTCRVNDSTAHALLSSSFERWAFLADYAAVLNQSTNTIEAALRTLGPISSMVALARLTGKRTVRGASLRIDTEGTSLQSAEISLASDELRAVDGALQRLAPISLKIRTAAQLTPETAVTLLEDFSRSLFFDIDTAYGITLSLRAFPRATRQAAFGLSEVQQLSPPAAPKHNYNQQATSLYFYGRSASNMPLLQFLAFYQVLEFFFPAYARTETIQRFQRRLKDPTFDPTNVSQVATLVSFLSAEAKALQYEDAQLRATIDGCTDDLEIRTFVESSDARKAFLCTKNQLRGVSHLNLQQAGNVAPLVAQVAQRVYEIRNRIVHAKEDGGPRGGDLLLPFGPEAALLQHDIAVVRFLAQRALIQDATRASWRI